MAGTGRWRELKRANTYTLSVPDPVVALPAIAHTASNYTVTLKVVVDPDRDALLIDYEVSGAGVRLYPLLAPHLGVYQQQAPSNGTGNFVWVDPADNALFASAAGNRSVCLLATPGFDRGSAGYVGERRFFSTGCRPPPGWRTRSVGSSANEVANSSRPRRIV